MLNYFCIKTACILVFYISPNITPYYTRKDHADQINITAFLFFFGVTLGSDIHVSSNTFFLHISKSHRTDLQHNTEYIRRPQSQPITWLQHFLQIVSCEGLHLGWLAISYKFICVDQL